MIMSFRQAPSHWRKSHPSACAFVCWETACTLIASPSILIFSPEVKSYKLKDFFVAIWPLGHKLRQGEKTHGAEEWVSMIYERRRATSKAEWESGSIKINSFCLTDLHGISTCLPHFFKYEFHLFPASPCTSSEKPFLGGNGFKAHTPDVPNALFEKWSWTKVLYQSPPLAPKAVLLFIILIKASFRFLHVREVPKRESRLALMNSKTPLSLSFPWRPVNKIVSTKQMAVVSRMEQFGYLPHQHLIKQPRLKCFASTHSSTKSKHTYTTTHQSFNLHSSNNR